MNVNFEKTDQVNGLLTVAFVEDDYKAEVKKELNRLGQTRPLKGFRPGHVPAALLQKFYGPQVKVQVIDRMLNRAVSDYIVNNKIAILGEPMPTDDTQVNLDTDKEFEFKFNLGMAPEFELTIDKNITVPYYNIAVTDDMVQKQNEGYRKRFGKQVPGEEAAIDSMLRGSLVELDDNGQEKADGIKAERTIIMPQHLQNEEQQQKFVGAKVGQDIVFNPHTACDGNAAEMASILNIDKENADQVTSDFKMTVNEVMVTQIADMDQEFFDNVLGKDEAKTEEEYMTKLREVIASGAIGELTSVHHLAAISYGKAAHAYCRGNWSVEAKGTGMLVNKCTHDFDLIEWWTKGKRCKKISSFGSLMHWRPENKPAGAADHCKDCPEQVREKCPFDAYKIYYDRTDLRYHFADESDEAILNMIEKSPYGRCVYACGNDSVDHQTVLMEYDGGLTIILEMESYSQQRTRITHFYGTRGEVIADEHKIEILPFLGDSTTIIPQQHGHHGGGDREIMTEFVKLVRTASPERYSAVLDAALESHGIAFLAEESRKTARTICD